ncbi:unnamed protein product [Caenorhabditis auriculariae]|uniref:Methyltransferase domain-containing protein n=1 Tax=Caenorhabditis auriculariae TaxID=2777116 RepID=A0A8S1GM54_9PELO|nr:unnamed protein product [Caenorhabditis auriculariae]
MIVRRLLPVSRIYQECIQTSCYSENRVREKDNDDYEALFKSPVTSINTVTSQRSTVQLESKKEAKISKFGKQYNLPQEAITGLRSALLSCDRPPRQLQNEADQLDNKLEQRRFPASPEKLKEVRDQVKKKLRKGKEKEEDWNILNDDSLSEKSKEREEYHIRNEVDKILKKSSFNWRPLELKSKEAAASYSLARLAPNYAEISRCLSEFSRIPDFTPRTVLDYGSGSGAALWAILSKWPQRKDQKSVDQITLVEISDAMARFSMDTFRKNAENSDVSDEKPNPFVHENIFFRRNLLPSPQSTYDLVIAHRVLCEIGSTEARLKLIESLWQRTDRFLLLVESASMGGFAGILEARDFLLSSGIKIDHDQLQALLEEKRLFSEEVSRVLRNRDLSDYERFVILKDLLPPEIKLPTQLPTASVFAPCPHDLGCPLSEKSVCSFSTRYQAIRADGRRSDREKGGSEITNFSFVILEKTPHRPNNHAERILRNRKLGQHITCDVCTAFRGIQRMTLSKGKHGGLYKQTRSCNDGDVFPLRQKTVATESPFDLWKTAVSDK